MDDRDSYSTIMIRRSVRAFENRPLTPEHDSLLKSMVTANSADHGPFDAEMRVEQITLTPYERDRLKVGSYGFISGQQGFLIGICQRKPRPLMNLGYSLEQMVLAMTSKGIGTCWMVSSFKRSAFEGRIELGQDEIIAAVIAYGYPRGRPTLFDRTSRKLMKSDSRRPWSELFFKDDFSTYLNEGDAPEMARCLESIRQAPSGENRQPWRAVVFDGGLHLYIERVTAYASKRHGFDMQYMDMGIAMAHADAIIGERGRWVFDEPGLKPPNQEYEFIATLLIE